MLSVARDYWCYPIDFVVAGSTSPLHSRPVPLGFTCDWNHLADCLAGAASKIRIRC